MPMAKPNLVAARSLLVLGGARSGKSAYAQSLAESAAPRAALPRHSRGGRCGDGGADRAPPGRPGRRLDDAGGAPGAGRGAERRDAGRPGRARRLPDAVARESHARGPRRSTPRSPASRQAISALEGPAVIVSNEVGLGLVPETRLGRDFRDSQGRANREVAHACDAVVLMAAGLPSLIKPAAPPAFTPALKTVWRLNGATGLAFRPCRSSRGIVTLIGRAAPVAARPAIGVDDGERAPSAGPGRTRRAAMRAARHVAPVRAALAGAGRISTSPMMAKSIASR